MTARALSNPICLQPMPIEEAKVSDCLRRADVAWLYVDIIVYSLVGWVRGSILLLTLPHGGDTTL
jgi:hypothetical protein